LQEVSIPTYNHDLREVIIKEGTKLRDIEAAILTYALSHQSDSKTLEVTPVLGSSDLKS
jgi:hypothetical protein